MITNKNNFLLLLLLPLVGTLVLAGSLRAGTVLIDDFSDANDDGWSHRVSPAPTSGGPGVFDASSGEYQLSTTGDVPQGGVGGVVATWDASTDPMYSEGYVRAKVRAETAGTTVSLLLRTQAGPINGYLFSATSVGADTPPVVNPGEDFGVFSMQVLDQVTNPDLAFLPSSEAAFRAGEDWIFEAGTVGDQISFKVWKDGDAEPAVPQMIATDTTFTAGQIGLTAEILFGVADPTQTSAFFDDIYFTAIPEPSALTLMGLGVFGMMMCSLLRRRRNN